MKSLTTKKAYDDASEPVEDTEAPEAEAVEEPAHQARPATRETTVAT